MAINKAVIGLTCLLLISACATTEKNDTLPPTYFLGLYSDYALAVKSQTVHTQADHFFSRFLYEKNKAEFSQPIDLSQRGTVRLSYVPLSNLDSYDFKWNDASTACLKLNGSNAVSKRTSVLLSYVQEGESWRINKIHASLLESSESYESIPICISDVEKMFAF